MTLRLHALTKIDASQSQCWERLIDLDTLLERTSDNRLKVRRLKGTGLAQKGDVWDVSAQVAGQKQQGQFEIVTLDEPQRCTLRGGNKIYAITLDVELTEIGPETTGLGVKIIVIARTLRGRILLKPLSVMAPVLQGRFADKVNWVVSRLMN